MTQLMLEELNMEDVPEPKRGKVRDIFKFNRGDKDEFLIVTTDRISAFDHRLPSLIPGKGFCLNQMSLLGFNYFDSVVPNAIISVDVEDFPPECHSYRDILAGRSMLVAKAEPLIVECIVRGYISGSGWDDYCAIGEICGIRLPAGLKESDQLPNAIFTPSTKAERGEHDVNINFSVMVNLVGEKIAEEAKSISLRIYKEAAAAALPHGIIIADTKFEFGLIDDQLVLIDEVLTPDSSRFWPCDKYNPGGPQPSFDKQFVRDHLKAIGWNKKPPVPSLPSDIIKGTAERYQQAYNIFKNVFGARTEII